MAGSEAVFCGVGDKRGFSWLTLRCVFIIVPNRIACKRHRAQMRCKIAAHALNYRHLILRKRARFIRANNLRATKRFNSRKFANNGMLFAHFGNANRKHDGNNCSQALRNSGNSKRHGNHKGRKYKADVRQKRQTVFKQRNTKNNGANYHNTYGKRVRKFGKLFLKRRFFILNTAYSSCNFTHFGIHTTANNNSASPTKHHGRAHIAHVFAIA